MVFLIFTAQYKDSVASIFVLLASYQKKLWLFLLGPLNEPQGLLGVQNGGSEKTLANSRTRVSKNFEDFDCFKSAAGFLIGYFRSRGLLFARVFSKPPPSRHFEPREDPGDERGLMWRQERMKIRSWWRSFQSRSQSPQAFLSAVGRLERLWGNRIKDLFF